jgi:hypothetical protein
MSGTVDWTDDLLGIARLMFKFSRQHVLEKDSLRVHVTM